MSDCFGLLATYRRDVGYRGPEING